MGVTVHIANYTPQVVGPIQLTPVPQPSVTPIVPEWTIDATGAWALGAPVPFRVTLYPPTADAIAVIDGARFYLATSDGPCTLSALELTCGPLSSSTAQTLFEAVSDEPHRNFRHKVHA